MVHVVVVKVTLLDDKHLEDYDKSISYINVFAPVDCEVEQNFFLHLHVETTNERVHTMRLQKESKAKWAPHNNIETKFGRKLGRLREEATATM